MQGQRPIGWWVKRLDQVLEQLLDSAVAGEGLTRRHWQVLHGLATTGEGAGAPEADLAPFGTPADIAAVVADLAGRQWVRPDPDGAPVLTEPGRSAHARLLSEVTGLRRQVTDGLSAEDYARTLAVLELMVGNAERALGGEPSGGQPRR